MAAPTAGPSAAADATLPVARWVFTAKLVCMTPLAFGADDLQPSGAPQCPALTGTTLAGVLRSHLADRIAGYGAPEPPEVVDLFGASRGNPDRGGQSSVIAFDSAPTPTDEPRTDGHEAAARRRHIRDRLRRDPARGLVAPNAKFDVAVLPAGTCLPVRVELVVTGDDDEPAQLARLVAALEGLAPGEAALGAFTTRGLGTAATADWRACRYDLTTADGWMCWVATDHLQPLPPATERHDTAAAACSDAATQPDGHRVKPAAAPPDRRRRSVLHIPVLFPAGVLFGSTPADLEHVDLAATTAGGQEVATGSGVAGVLRQQALRVATQLAGYHDDGAAALSRARKAVAALFGPRVDPARTDQELWASRLRVAEVPLDVHRRAWVTRHRGDRFAGGVHGDGLFTEQLPLRATAVLVCEVRNPQPGELGLVLLAVRDLLDGLTALGGTVAVGRGRTCPAGPIRVTTYDGTGEPPKVDEVPSPPDGPPAWVDDDIATVRRTLTGNRDDQPGNGDDRR